MVCLEQYKNQERNNSEKMSGYEYEDETEGITWSIVNDIKQVMDDILGTITLDTKQVSS